MNNIVYYFISDFFMNLHKYNALVVLVPLFTYLALRIGSRYKRYYDFKRPFVPLLEILENRKLPDMSASEYTQFFNNMLATQEVASRNIKVKMSRKRRDIFNRKWDEYKKKCEPYKNGGIRAYVLFELQKDNNELLSLINEILKIAKKN